MAVSVCVASWSVAPLMVMMPVNGYVAKSPDPYLCTRQTIVQQSGVLAEGVCFHFINVSLRGSLLFPAAPPVPNYCHSISSSTSATQLFLGTWETILAICRRASALVSVPTRTTHRELNHELNSTQRIIHKRWRLLQFVVVLV